MKTYLTMPRKTFLILNNLMLILFSITILYPFINTIAKSFSGNNAIISGKVLFWPVDFTLYGYKQTFNSSSFFTSLQVTILITLIGTLLVLLVTVTSAYALSRPSFPGKNVFFAYYIFTMFFSGGIIPMFILIKNIKLYDSIWALILPGIVNISFVIITVSFFKSIPEEIQESARIDGASDIVILFRIILPVSKPILATLALFSGVGFWNTFMSAILFMSDYKKYPLQPFVRMLVMDQLSTQNLFVSTESLDTSKLMTEGVEPLKNAIIMVSTIPIVIVYPFLQRYFTKGLIIGAVKG